MICRLPVLIDEYNAQIADKGLPSSHRISQRKLAEQLKLATSTVNRLYQNKFDRVDVGTVEKICEFFKCDVGDLFVMREVSNA